jgi:hypothetical protein
MKGINQGVLVLFVLAASLAQGQAAAQPFPVSVNCGTGQSLNGTLSRLDPKTSYTISVKGTCAEYVHVIGFQNLTLKGLPGAKLVQPATSPGNIGNNVLYIEASQSVTVQGLNIQADTTTVSAVSIGHGSTDIRLRNLTVTGGVEGIVVFENSQASIAYVTAQDPGYATLAIYDSSDVHVEHCAFQDSTGAFYHVGIALGAAHITMYATTISNMQVGIDAENGSIVDMWYSSTYYPLIGPADVTIENTAGTSYNGVTVDDGSQLNVSEKLVIDKPGQSWGGTTGGVLVSNGSSLYAPSGSLAITGSYGDGILVLNNSHALVGAFTVTGSGHGGLVAANLSSIDVDASTAPSLVGGNAVDLFCDSRSVITGGANIAGVPTAQCANLLATETTPLP